MNLDPNRNTNSDPVCKHFPLCQTFVETESYFAVKDLKSLWDYLEFTLIPRIYGPDGAQVKTKTPLSILGSLYYTKLDHLFTKGIGSAQVKTALSVS